MAIYFINRIFTLCVCAEITVTFEHKTERLEASLAADFIEFYNFKYVHIIYAGNEEINGYEDKIWMKWTHRKITEGKHSFASVIPVRSTRNNDSHFLEGDQSDSQIPIEYSSNDSFILPSRDILNQGHSTLFVFRLHNKSDATVFGKLFRETDGMDWLLIADSTFPDVLRHTYLPINSKVTIAMVTPEKESARFWQIYQVAPYLEQKIQAIGQWIHHGHGNHSKEEQGIFSLPDPDGSIGSSQSPKSTRFTRLKFGVANLSNDNLILQRLDLTGLHLRCTTIEDEPYMFLINKPDGSVEVLGSIGAAFNHLQEVTNFTFTCRRVKDSAWGSKVDGDWNGVVGEVLRGEADIAVADLDITPQRSTVVDFLIGLVEFRKTVFMRRPSHSDEFWTGYSKEFERNTWISLAVFLIVVIVCTYCSFRGHHLPIHQPMSDAAITIIGFLLGQGTPIQPKHASLRMIFLTALLFHVLILAHYSSDLVSVLAAGPPPPRISSLIDVAKDPDLQFGYLKGSASNEYIRDSSVEAIRQLWLNNKANNFASLFSSQEEGIQRVLQGKHLYMEDEFYILYTYGQDCRFFHLPTTYFPGQLSLAITKGSPIQPILNKVLLDARSSGLLDRWMTAYIPKIADCNALETSAMDMKSVSVPFMILGMAMVISMMVLTAECWTFKRSTSK